MHLRQQQKPIYEDKAAHLVAGQLEVFGMVGKPLPTGFNRGMSPEAIAALLGHTKHRSLDMTLRYAKIASRTVADEYFAVTQKV